MPRGYSRADFEEEKLKLEQFGQLISVGLAGRNLNGFRANQLQEYLDSLLRKAKMRLINIAMAAQEPKEDCGVPWHIPKPCNCYTAPNTKMYVDWEVWTGQNRPKKAKRQGRGGKQRGSETIGVAEPA